ncbi:MAG: hypothetical protein SFY80_12385 [Verrucomicrobiota bacterium]|nr:hypothetical protein [Verrucomicrobiota bacterium]
MHPYPHRPSFTISLLVLLVLSLVQSTAYSVLVTLNGKPVEASLISMNASPTAEPGDLLEIEYDRKWVLSDTNPHQLTSEDNSPYFWRVMEDGTKQLLVIDVAAARHLEGIDAAVKQTFIDPFDGLSDEQLGQVSSVYLNRLPPSFARASSKINWKRCLLEVDLPENDLTEFVDNLPDGLAYLKFTIRPGKLLITKPLALAYLYLDCHSSSAAQPSEVHFSDKLALSASTLRFLYIHSWVTLSPDDLSALTGLRNATINTYKGNNYSFISRCTELRKLNLRDTDFSDTSILAGLSKLSDLVLRSTQASDLRPLLQLQSLAFVDVSFCPLKDLPMALMPALREFRAFQVNPLSLSDTDFDAFRAINPQCKILYHWEDALRRCIANTDRIRIRTGGLCHRMRRPERTLVELDKPEEIAVFVNLIHIVESKDGTVSHCMCCGNPTVEFYQGELLMESISFHHGKSVRWHLLPSDAKLTSESAGKLLEWMESKGYTEFLREKRVEK